MKRSKLENFMEKKISVNIFFLTLFIWAGITWSYGWALNHVHRLGTFGKALETVSDFPHLVKKVYREIRVGGKQVIEDRFPDLDGFKNSGKIQAEVLEDKGFLLLSCYDRSKGQSTIQLIRISDQQIIHEWAPDIDTLEVLINTKIVKSSFRMFHPLLLEDGSLLFHGHDGSKGKLIKIDFFSNVEQIIDANAHHSIERDAEGNIWVPSQVKRNLSDIFGGNEPFASSSATSASSTFPLSNVGNLSINDDAIAKISPAGKVLFKKSVSKIIEENGYRDLLLIEFGSDVIHLNDIQPALTNSKFWKKGDLLLSMRNRNTIALYRPSSNKILWLKTGPWIGQHDANFVNDHQISVFGNDVIDYQGIYTFLDGHSNVYLYDFTSDTVSLPYKKIMKSMELRTVSSGRSKVLSNGDIFIEETDEGRIVRLAPDMAKWEFVRRVGENYLSLPSWSRYLTEEQVWSVLPKLQNPKSNP